MKLDAVRIGAATAIVFAVVWVICSLLVVFVPGVMMEMSGHMLHADLGNLNWTLRWTGFFVGLVAWTALSWVIAWAIAAVHNALLR